MKGENLTSHNGSVSCGQNLNSVFSATSSSTASRHSLLPRRLPGTVPRSVSPASRQTDSSTQYSVEIKNMWSYAPTATTYLRTRAPVLLLHSIHSLYSVFRIVRHTLDFVTEYQACALLGFYAPQNGDLCAERTSGVEG